MTKQDVQEYDMFKDIILNGLYENPYFVLFLQKF